MRSRVGAAGLGLLAATSHAGCSHCDAIGTTIAPPAIRVTNAATGAPICDATVVALHHGGDAGVNLVASGPPYPECLYRDLPDDGVYTLEVSKPGFQSATVPNVSVQLSDFCSGNNPTAQQVTVKLKPGQ
jgi:hypothetical protein